MRAALLAAEAEPFAKGGGLGDAVAGLARALAAAKVETTVVLPLYREVLARGHRPAPEGRTVTLAHDGCERTASLLTLRQDGVRYLFVAEDGYFDRPGIYGEDGQGYPDSAQRFSFFTRAALAALEAEGFPDVLHCNDWHVALAPWYLAGRGRRPPVLLTIHNLAYQGVFDPALLGALGLPSDSFRLDGLEFYGRVNFLKGGIVAADAVNTVSPTYAREILDPEQGAGLEGVLASRTPVPSGILNGIDAAAWDPQTDPDLPRAYSARSPAGKAACKQALQRELRLAEEAEAPLFAFIGRLTEQKGVGLVEQALPRLLALGGQLALLGSGEARYEEIARRATSDHPGSAAARILFDPALARRIYAGCDFFLMPSLFEPCGLGQMYALRYGALPVARRTGGLADTVRDLTADPAGGNGFVFDAFTGEALAEAVSRAVFFHGSKGRAKTIARVMREDHSWKGQAREYLALYRSLAGPGKGR